MKTLTAAHLDLVPWYIFGAYWAITALRVKRTKASEKSVDRFATVALMCVAFGLLFYDWSRVPFLEARFVTPAAWIEWSGVLLTSLGVAIAIWARHCLGVYWSARVTLKEDHRLIDTGPYRVVRHPIYTGMLVAAIGTALVSGEWRALLAVALILFTHSRKALREEALLTKEFGGDYVRYRRTTGFLFPRLSRKTEMSSPASQP